MTCLKTAKAATNGTNYSYYLHTNPYRAGKDLPSGERRQKSEVRRKTW